MQILVVDDEKDIQRLFEQRFRREIRKGQVQLFFAFSGKDALEYLEKEQFPGSTVILSDINMPNMSGLELLKIIREKYPSLKMYIITAYDDDKNRREALDYGADDYLIKPIDFQVLKEKVIGAPHLTVFLSRIIFMRSFINLKL